MFFLAAGSLNKQVQDMADRLLQKPVNLYQFEKKLLNRLQADLPLVPEPFAIIAEELGVSEADVLNTLRSLKEMKVITRFGPLFDIVKNKGALSLCALKVSEERIDEVSSLVNSYTQVAHNYLRENEWNMWFVLATKSQQELNDTFKTIVEVTGCRGIDCPKEKEFFVGLFLPA
jgi:siroheme decarboxylase